MQSKTSTADVKRVPAKALLADAILYLDVEDWTRPVIRAALAVAEFMAGAKTTANPKLEDLAPILGRSTRRIAEALAVVWRRPDEIHEARHIFLRRLVSSGAGRGRKYSVYELDPEFEAAVLAARDARTPYRKDNDLQDGIGSARSVDLQDAQAGPTGRSTDDLQDAQGSRKPYLLTPFVESRERERSRTDDLPPPDLEQQARSAALHYFGVMTSWERRRRPTEFEIKNTAAIAKKALEAGHDLSILNAASSGAIEAAKRDAWMADRVKSPAFVWSEKRIEQHAALPSKLTPWEKAGFQDPDRYVTSFAEQKR